MASNKDKRSPQHGRANYEPPRLRCLGDLREQTLGSSGCAPDSPHSTGQPDPVNGC
jgi:hypothetical protein